MSGVNGLVEGDYCVNYVLSVSRKLSLLGLWSVLFPSQLVLYSRSRFTTVLFIYLEPGKLQQGSEWGWGTSATLSSSSLLCETRDTLRVKSISDITRWLVPLIFSVWKAVLLLFYSVKSQNLSPSGTNGVFSLACGPFANSLHPLSFSKLAASNPGNNFLFHNSYWMTFELRPHSSPRFAFFFS